MKKVVGFTLALAIIFSLCACGVQKTDETFLTNLRQGLEARWEQLENEDSYEESQDSDRALVYSELDAIGDLSEYTFSDTTLAGYASAYIDALNSQLEGAQYYGLDDAKYDELFTVNGANVRAILISKFVDEYGLTVSATYADYLDNMVNCGHEFQEAANSVKSENLGLTLDEMISVISDAWDIYSSSYVTFETHETAEFTVYKYGAIQSCICFSLPNEDNLCAVFYVIDEDYRSTTTAREECVAAQSAMIDYCNNNDIGADYTTFTSGEQDVYAVIANNCGFSAEDFPVSVQELRSGNEFFASDERTEEYYNYLGSCDFEGLYDYLIEYTESEDAVVDEFLENIIDLVSQSATLVSSCDVNYDEFEDETTVMYSGLTDIGWDQCIVPVITTSKSSSSAGKYSLDYKVGFINSDWIFFDSIIIISGDERDEIDVDVLNAVEDVLGGGSVREYHTLGSTLYSIMKSVAENGEGAIRFENTDEEKTLDHTLTDLEIAAADTLIQLSSLNNHLYYGPRTWSKM